MDKKFYFLGGSCGDSKWRDAVIAALPKDICFNPVVEYWTPACVEIENEHKRIDDYCVYVFSPKTKGLYSIAEAVDSAHKNALRTIVFILEDDDGVTYDKADGKAMKAVLQLIRDTGVKHAYAGTLEGLVQVLKAIYENSSANQWNDLMGIIKGIS